MREECPGGAGNAPGISTPLIDSLITTAQRAGSIGAKVCGAGGGGCVVFLTLPMPQQRVAQALRSAGAKVLDATWRRAAWPSVK